MGDNLPPCAKRRYNARTRSQMCYAIGCETIGDMLCQCEECLRDHGGRCPEGKDRKDV